MEVVAEEEVPAGLRLAERSRYRRHYEPHALPHSAPNQAMHWEPKEEEEGVWIGLMEDENQTDRAVVVPKLEVEVELLRMAEVLRVQKAFEQILAEEGVSHQSVEEVVLVLASWTLNDSSYLGLVSVLAWVALYEGSHQDSSVQEGLYLLFG